MIYKLNNKTRMFDEWLLDYWDALELAGTFVLLYKIFQATFH